MYNGLTVAMAVTFEVLAPSTIFSEERCRSASGCKVYEKVVPGGALKLSCTSLDICCGTVCAFASGFNKEYTENLSVNQSLAKLFLLSSSVRKLVSDKTVLKSKLELRG